MQLTTLLTMPLAPNGQLRNWDTSMIHSFGDFLVTILRVSSEIERALYLQKIQFQQINSTISFNKSRILFKGSVDKENNLTVSFILPTNRSWKGADS